MRAIVIIPDEQSGTLALRDVPDPTPGPQDLLIQVKATALNRADLAQRRGRYPAAVTAADSGLAIGGLEAAGEVIGMGTAVAGFAVGDRVMAMCGGGYAAMATIDHRLALRIPERLSWEEAATIPVAYMTEHDALITNGGELAKLSPETMEAFNKLLPSAWSHNNPVDILGDASPERYAKALEIAKELGLPIRYAGIGEKVDDLVKFEPELYVNGLFN